MRTSALFGAKHQIFRNLGCVRTDKGGRGLSQYGQEEEGVVRTSFMDGPKRLCQLLKVTE